MSSVQIFYGSETDTALDLAEELGEGLQEAGIDFEVVDMQDREAASLVDVPLLVVITSTFGDGEPPYNAKDFHDALHLGDMPRLEQTKFAVLALGDRSYPHFCQCGKDFDARLEALGAQRILDRHECDGDPASVFEQWRPKIIDVLRTHTS